MQRLLTGSDGKVAKDVVTLDEEQGEIMLVEKGHDVERVSAILKNPTAARLPKERP